MKPPNNESIGTANFFHYLEVFFIERYKSIEEYANGTLEKFHYERFFTIWGSSLSEVPLYCVEVIVTVSLLTVPISSRMVKMSSRA